MFINQKGVSYRQLVNLVVKKEYPKHNTIDKPVKVKIDFYPPDKRKRDVDNVLKCLLDSLTKANVYRDDSLIIDLRIRKMEMIRNAGKIEVVVNGISETER